MIARIFLTPRKGNHKMYLFEKRVVIKGTNIQKFNVTKLFHYLVTAGIEPLFKDKTIKFNLQNFEYWTQINGNQQFYKVNTSAIPTFKTLPAMIKRHEHHLIDLYVQYSSPD